jgi:hypothetical protein
MWMAWTSDSTTSPSVRFMQSTVPYQQLDGTVVANDFAGLVSGSLLHGITLSETMMPVTQMTGLETWTGTDATGNFTDADCADWTDATSGQVGTVGVSGDTDGTWSDVYLQFCDRMNVRLYCFQQ